MGLETSCSPLAGWGVWEVAMEGMCGTGNWLESERRAQNTPRSLPPCIMINDLITVNKLGRICSFRSSFSLCFALTFLRFCVMDCIHFAMAKQGALIKAYCCLVSMSVTSTLPQTCFIIWWSGQTLLWTVVADFFNSMHRGAYSLRSFPFFFLFFPHY